MTPGQVLGGRYAVGEVIGRGGLADVHVGRDIRSGRWVAIKALRTNLAKDPAFRTSLQREAQTMERLSHDASRRAPPRPGPTRSARVWLMITPSRSS